MNKADRISATIAIIYFVMAVISFGHSAANNVCDRTIEYQSCSEQASLSGMGAAFLWPFYWSWEIQS